MQRFRIVIILLIVFFKVSSVTSQELYNNCNDALSLCPNQSYAVNNIGANKTFCPGCEDDFTFCFSASNTIWLTFTTNAVGGNVQIDFDNLVFETNPGQGNQLQATLLSAGVPCNAASYSAIGNCVNNATGNFTLNAAGLTPATAYYIVVNGLNTGAGVTQAAECSFDISVTGAAVDRPVPTVAISFNSSDVCLNELVTCTATLQDCPDSTDFQWYVNGVFTAQTSLPLYQTTGLSDGDIVEVQTTCFSICTELVTNTTLPINVYSFPIDAGTSVLINAGETTQLTGTTSAPVFSWSPSFNVSNPSILNPFVTPNETTTYTLTAAENGCTLSDQVTIFIQESLLFPTTFSPNDDGANDKWEIGAIDLYPDCFVRIFNRWGQEIYQSTGYSKEKAWDGTNSNGSPLAEGVYFYVVDLRDEEKQQFKGSITLIR